MDMCNCGTPCFEAEGCNLLERNMPGHRPPCSPSASRRVSKRRSGPEHRRRGKQGRVRGHGNLLVADAGVLGVNNVVATSPQAPQDEARPDSADFRRMEFVVDETGLASEEAVAYQSGPQQEIRVGANARQPAPRTGLTRKSPSETRSLNVQTVRTVLEDANQHEVHKSPIKQVRFSNEEQLDYPAPAPTLHPEEPRVRKKRRTELQNLLDDNNLKAKSAAAAKNQPAAGARPLFRPSRGGKPNSSTLSALLLANKKVNNPISSSQVPDNYSRPPHPTPHPFDAGKVSHVNICPVCEKYTATELDSAAAGTGETTLRARFQCGLCREVFDLGIALFDPRGIPGVTLFEGEDRFQPPVAPRAKYPCPRCWKNTHTSFERMVLYLREESKVQCEPACPPERLDLSAWGKPEVEKPEARNVIRTVLGL